MDYPFWTEDRESGPLVAIAIHHGHGVRGEVAQHLFLDEEGRLREEDPFTGDWTAIAPTRIIVLRSRFEVDLNRPREKAVYRTPEDAWGLKVWKDRVPEEVFQRSLSEYDAFYSHMHELLSNIERHSGRFVVFDLHSYNHRREGPDAPAADPAMNPQVNLGTGSMDRTRWGPLVDRFIRDLRAYDFPGGRLDVRENIKFRGGNLSAWVHRVFPQTGCALAIEFKKFFMDEWTGEAKEGMVQAICAALHSVVPGLLEELTACEQKISQNYGTHH
jgi:N-formylglutamate amidohydrolase